MLETGLPPICYVGHYTSIGAGSVLISCRVDDLADIGDKCTSVEGAWVEKNTILEPVTVVPAYGRIPEGRRWGGNPTRFIAELTYEEKAAIKVKAEMVHEKSNEHTLELFPYRSSYLHLENLEKEGKTTIQG